MKRLFSAVFLLALAGCAVTPRAPDINISVNSLAATDVTSTAHSTYLLAPGQDGVTNGDLQYQEFSRYVERVLSAQGMKRTADPEQAEVVILLSYAIGDPKTFQSQILLPVWGRTGVSSLNTTGQVIGSNFNSTTTVTPSYGISGYSQVQTSSTYYVRNARLVAFKKEEIKKGSHNQLWNVSIVSSGQSGDLRYIFPYLVTAAAPYIGKNSGHMIDMALHVNDPRIAALIAP
jgi:hypothetical protein